MSEHSSKKPVGEHILLDAPVFFEVAGHRQHAPLLRATVAGVPTSLLLDTGGSHHGLTQSHVQQAGLTPRPAAPGMDHAGASVKTWALDSVPAEIGNYRADWTDLFVIEGPPLFDTLGIGGFVSPQHLHPGAWTVLDMVRSRCLLIKGDQTQLQAWVSSAHPEHTALCLSRVLHPDDRSDENRLLRIPASVEPFEPAATIMNSGTPQSEFIAQAMPGLPVQEPVVFGRGASGAVVEGWEALDRTLRVGPVRFPVPRVLVRPQPWGAEHLGMIGMDVLLDTVLVANGDLSEPVIWFVRSSSVDA